MKKIFPTLAFIFAACYSQGQFSAINVNSQTVTKGIGVIAADNSGNTILTGQFTTTLTLGSTNLTNNYPDNGINTSGNNSFIAKMAGDGSYAWVKKITLNNNPVKNACDPEISRTAINAVTTDGSGNIYITGSFKGSVNFDNITLTSVPLKVGACSPVWYDIFTAKISPAGNFLWAKAEGTNSVWSESGNAVTVDASGNIYTTGNLVQKAINGTTCNGGQWGGSGATTQQYLYLVKYNSAGTKQWEKKYSGNLYDCNRFLKGRSVVSDGTSVYVLGNFFGAVNFGGGNTFNAGSILNTVLLKLDGNGNTVWAKTISGAENQAWNLLLDNSNADIYVTGNFNTGTISFGNNQSITTANTQANYLAKYSTALGNCSWAIDAGKFSVLTSGQHQFKHPNGNICTPGRDASNNLGINEFSNADGSLIASTTATNVAIGSGTNIVDIVGTSNGFMYTQNFNGSYDFGGITIASTQPPTSSYIDMMLVKHTTAPPPLVARTDLPTIEASTRIILYPNPSANQITIQNSDNKMLGTISVYDMTGKLISKNRSVNSRMTIDVKKFTAGVYYIKSDNLQATMKFVKQ